MADTVVDASVIAAIVFGEPEIEAARALIAEGELIAPYLLTYELANIAVTKIRKGLNPAEAVHRRLADFDRLAIRLIHVDHRDAAAMGARERLSAYDASYLVLAATRGAKLITFDRALDAAARRLVSSLS